MNSKRIAQLSAANAAALDRLEVPQVLSPRQTKNEEAIAALIEAASLEKHVGEKTAAAIRRTAKKITDEAIRRALAV